MIDSLLQCTAGQIVACNVLAGVEHRLIDRAWAKNTLAWMGRLGTHADYGTPDKLVRALQDLRDGRVAPSVAARYRLPEVRLRDDAAPRPFPVEVSCVVPAHRLAGIVSHEDRLRLAREGLALPLTAAEFSANSTVNEWRSKPARERTVRLDPRGSLGRRRSVVWFTRREVFAKTSAGASANDRTEEVRDKLGLIHHRAGTMLAALHFPRVTLAGIASARPTFADAAHHRRFKTWPDGVGARRRRHWGTTVDLQALDADATSVDGWAERVTKEIDGAALGEGRFEFELLGPVPAPRDTGGAADAAFAARLAGGRTTAEVAQELKSL